MALTIHGIDPELDRRLSERARRDRMSKNQLVKRLLARAMGLAESDPENEDKRRLRRYVLQVHAVRLEGGLEQPKIHL